MQSVLIFKVQTCATLLLVTCYGDTPLLKTRSAEQSASCTPTFWPCGRLSMVRTCLFSSVTLPKYNLTENFLGLGFVRTWKNSPKSTITQLHYPTVFDTPAASGIRPVATRNLATTSIHPATSTRSATSIHPATSTLAAYASLR